MARIVPFAPGTAAGVPAEVQFQVTEPEVGMVEAVAVPPVKAVAPSSGLRISVLAVPTTVAG